MHIEMVPPEVRQDLHELTTAVHDPEKGGPGQLVAGPARGGIARRGVVVDIPVPEGREEGVWILTETVAFKAGLGYS